MAKVFLGVGHGGADPGAIGNGFYESNLNLAIALACNDELVRHGVTTMMSREKDEDDTLIEEINECIAFKPDLAIDIHNNAGGGDGVEVFHSVKRKNDDAFAQNVLDAIVAIGQNSRGLKTKTLSNGDDYFGFIRQIGTKLGIPSILVECAFVDNATDITIINTPAKQKAMGVAVAKGILKTLGITYKAPTTTTSTASNVMYTVQVGAFKEKTNADIMLAKVKAAGFNAFIKETESK